MRREIALAAIVVVLVAVPAAAFAQGLGDASKKEKQRKAKSATTAKTYTEEGLQDLDPVANEEDAKRPAESPAAVSRRSSTPRRRSGERSSRLEEEEKWRARVREAQARVAEERAVYEHWARQSLVPGYELVDEDSRIVAGTVEELQAITARAKARLEAAEKALEDLRERARREGVPPGWLR